MPDQTVACHDPDLAPVVAMTRELVELLGNSPVTRVCLETSGVRLEIEAAPLPKAESAQPPSTASETVPESESTSLAPSSVPDGAAVRAPLTGVFYRRPAPDAPPFAEPGDSVEAGAQLGIVEAMKMMNPIVAEHAGTVRAILVDDGAVVEFNQVLMTLDETG